MAGLLLGWFGCIGLGGGATDADGDAADEVATGDVAPGDDDDDDGGGGSGTGGGGDDDDADDDDPPGSGVDTSGPSTTDTGSACTGSFTVTIGSLPTYEAERLCPGAVHRYELPGVRVDVTLEAPDCTAVEMALEPSGTTIGGCGGVGATATALEVRHVQGPGAPYTVSVLP